MDTQINKDNLNSVYPCHPCRADGGMGDDQMWQTRLKAAVGREVHCCVKRSYPVGNRN